MIRDSKFEIRELLSETASRVRPQSKKGGAHQGKRSEILQDGPSALWSRTNVPRFASVVRLGGPGSLEVTLFMKPKEEHRGSRINGTYVSGLCAPELRRDHSCEAQGGACGTRGKGTVSSSPDRGTT